MLLAVRQEVNVKIFTGILILKSDGKEITDPKQFLIISIKCFYRGKILYLDMPTIIIDIITRLLPKINPSNATGPDVIPMRVLKEAAAAIAPYLCFIFQQSSDTGSVPADWKPANIMAVFQKGPTTEALKRLNIIIIIVS